jgi:hypothetical protein
LNWFSFLDKKTEKHYTFGRGINADIPKQEEELFDLSYTEFEKKNILQAYEYFFLSQENFCNDTSNNNIILTKQNEKLLFEIFQGSALIHGYVTAEHLYAEAILVKAKDASVALKRYLLERNYQLTYANYFIEDAYIKMKLYHDNITMNPHKVFFPIRELALNADFDKEYIRYEFSDTPLEDIEHLEPLSLEELHVKYDAMMQWFTELENKIATFPSNDNAGMKAFAYLNILFQIDYLIVPKYNIYQKLSKKVQEYFSEEDLTTEAKNEELKEYIDELHAMNFEDFTQAFYKAKYTFNPSDRTPQEEINNFISESMLKIRWYKNNRYNQIIPTIYKYIAFYILYNYGVHPLTRSLLHLLVQIQNQAYFAALGYPLLYNEKENTFSKRTIISKVEDIITPYQSRFKELKLFGSDLNFTSLNEFSNSFYTQIKHLNFEEV